MTIWALKGPSTDDYDPVDYKETIDFLSNSIKSGFSRFGWGYMDNSDLRYLEPRGFEEMSKKEIECWEKASFLLDVLPGDWVVHINLPYWGACIAGQVIEGYSFETEDNDISDYRHMLKLDVNTIVEFERNDPEVLPIISSRLKLQGRYWRIQYVEEFLRTIENIKSESLGKKEDESVGLFYLKQDLTPLLREIANRIQKTHPASNLETLMAEVFRKIPNVIDVKENGKTKGWGSDYGADLIVTYKSGLSISNLEKEEILVVQVKSFVGDHWETNAVNQIEEGIKTYKANAGLIISTAETTTALETAIEKLSDKLSKPEPEGLNKVIPIGLIAGTEVARFVLKYGGGFIL